MSHFYGIIDGEPRLLEDVTTPAQARKYRGTALASVTTMIKLWPNEFIGKWRDGKLVELAREFPHLTIEEVTKLTWGVRTAPDGRELASSDFGTEVHAHLENAATAYSRGEGYDAGAWAPYVDPWIDWLTQNNVSVIAVEKMLYDMNLLTCGMLDFIGEKDGRVFLSDFKTRSGNGNIKSKSYDTDIMQLGIEAEMVAEKMSLDYIPRCYSVIIDTDTAEYYVKLWSPVMQRRGADRFRMCAEFYNKVHGFAEA